MRLPWYERWRVFLACGVFMTLGSGLVFWDLTEWEAHPDESRSMPWLAVLIYRVGGKWLLSGVALAIGLFLTVEGLRRRRIQARRQSPADPGAKEPRGGQAADGEGRGVEGDAAQGLRQDGGED